uniref:Serine protease HTRA2, mitochondrial n=1 Tax=Plectus sambesii TaxID=2011161 RepID=A0A914XAA7_9BILA
MSHREQLLSALSTRLKSLEIVSIVHASTFFPHKGTQSSDDSEGSKSIRDRLNFFADLVEKVAPAVVHVQVSSSHSFGFGGTQITAGGGSGLIVRSDGLILTNAHVVGSIRNSQLTITLNDGRKFNGRLVKLDRRTDLAIVKIDGAHDLPVLRLADSTKVRPGEFVVALGSPFTLSNSVTMGIVSNPKRSLNELGLSAPIHYVQTDAAINVGNSGGPLINLDGEVVGINAMKLANSDGVSFAVPAIYVEEFLQGVDKQIATGSKVGYPRRRFVGLAYYLLDDETKRQDPDYASLECGAVVHSVTVGSPAHFCGIEPGDVITKINGQQVNSTTNVQRALHDATKDTLDLEISRHGRQFKVSLKFGDQ